MGGVALAELAAAVSEAGGLGLLGLTSFSPQEIESEIRRVRQLTAKPFGVGLLFPIDLPASAPLIPPSFPDFLAPLWERVRALPAPPSRAGLTLDLVRAQLDVVVRECVPLLACGLGSPEWVVERAHAAGVKVASLVGSVRAAKSVEALGVDLIVAQGHEAGGHVGAAATLTLIPQVVDTVRTCVVAAGGIGDGRGVAAALALGAQGVWIGTRLLATPEAQTSAAHKERVLTLNDEDTVVSRAYSGKPSRVIRNTFTRLWRQHEGDILPMPAQRMWMEPIAARARVAGIIDIGNFPTGQVAGLVREIKPAGEVIRELVRDTVDVITKGLVPYTTYADGIGETSLGVDE